MIIKLTLTAIILGGMLLAVSGNNENLEFIALSLVIGSFMAILLYSSIWLLWVIWRY